MQYWVKRFLLSTLLLSVAVFNFVHPSQFSFSLTSREEECFLEDVNARTTNNYLLFLFGLVEPSSSDFIDVQIRSPTGQIVQSWNKTQANHATMIVRESGLYHLCFIKRTGASKELILYYSFDLISTGTETYRIYPTTAATLSKDTPDQATYTTMDLSTSHGKPTKIGLLDFDFHDVSSSIIQKNTRVHLALTTSFVSKSIVEISIAKYPKNMSYPATWNTLSDYIDTINTNVFDTATTSLGDHMDFDVTDLVSNALENHKDTLTFSLHVNEDADATVTSMSYTTSDYFPQIVFEDLGLDIMHEISYFKIRVFELRGEIQYILKKERVSRSFSESANARVKWMSLLINFVLVGIAFAQVLYIRKMLESSY